MEAYHLIDRMTIQLISLLLMCVRPAGDLMVTLNIVVKMSPEFSSMKVISIGMEYIAEEEVQLLKFLKLY